MTKIGVGVGEDFPVEDQSGQTAGQTSGQTSGQAGGPSPEGAPGGDYRGYGACGWGRMRDESYEDWRARRDAWRRQRHEWRAQRREWRRRFRAEMHARGYRRHGFPFYPVVPFVAAAVVLSLLLTGFFTVVFSAPALVLGLVLLAVLYAAHRHREHFHDYDYAPPPSGPGNTANTTPTANTPSAPPSAQGS